MSAVHVEVVSDFVCPWCLIGTRRLEKALEGRDAEVAYRPFLLDPSVPLEGVDLRAHLEKKFKGDLQSMFAHVESAAKESGIPLDFSKVTRYPSTLRAHALVSAAEERGTQRALASALFDAYFLEGRDIGSLDVLAELGVAHGFGRDEAKRIADDDAAIDEAREEAAGIARQGIGGVPFFVFNQKFGVSGAQPVAVFERAIAILEGKLADQRRGGMQS